MSRITALFLALFFSMAALAVAADPGGGDPATGTAWAEVSHAQDDEDFARAAKDAYKVNSAFLDVAARMVEESGDPDADVYMKKALVHAREGLVHLEGGDFEFAVEDFMESTRVAVYAVILSEGAGARKSGLREAVEAQEALIYAEAEHERKEQLIKKGFTEALTFINTAERLLAESYHQDARMKVDEAKDLYRSARYAVSRGNYDKALYDVNRAYKLSTDSIREIKSSEGDIITFPRPSFTDDRAVYLHELKRNETYMVLAENIVAGGESEKMLKEADKIRDAAIRAFDKGEKKAAIEKMKDSTRILIDTIKGIREAE